MRSVPFVLSSIALATLASEVFAQCPAPPSAPSAPAGPPPVLVTGRGSGTAPTSPSASSPSSPGPAGPSTPGAGGPSTGGPSTPRGGPSTGGAGSIGGGGGPSSGGGGMPAVGGGAPIEFKRGRTSLDRLEIEWDYPLPEDAEAQALSFAAALDAIRGDDPRPLIVVRECQACQGTAKALLDGSQSDEKTKLMTRWFHCVRLPNHAWNSDHPFSELFAKTHGAHLFIASADGSMVVPFNGVQPRPALWRAMHDVIENDYRGDSERTLAKLVKHLDVYDRIDAKIEDALVQADRALEHHGPQSSKYAKAEKRLERDRKELEAAIAREERIAELDLRKGDD